MILRVHEHPDSTEHYNAAPHDDCKCRVCSLKREIADLKRQLAERDRIADRSPEGEDVSELRTSLDAALYNKHNGGSVSSRWTVDSILEAILPIVDAYVREKVDAKVEEMLAIYEHAFEQISKCAEPAATADPPKENGQ